MADIVLISAQQNLDTIGLKYVHQYLLESGKIDTILLYIPIFAKQKSRGHLKDFLISHSPKVIGISLTVEDYSIAVETTKLIREILPSVYVIWGGIEPTTEPERCLQWADFVCIGEGELPIKDFILKLKSGATYEDLQKVNNMAFLSGGKLNINSLYPLITDLDSLPILRQIPENSYVDVGERVEPLQVKHLYRFKRYRGQVLKVMTSRGCPYGCTFCCNRYLRMIYGKWPVRQRSVKHVIEEIELGLREGPKTYYIDIADDCFFSSDLDYIKEFCYEYKKRFNIPFIAKTTPHEVSEEKMDLLTDAGLTWINMGLQSGSDYTCLKIYKRATTAENFLKAAEIISKYPIGVYYDIIVDNPYERLEDKLKTAETLAQVPHKFIPLIASLRFYPGTELRRKAIEDKIIDADCIEFGDIFAWEKNAINKLIRCACFIPTSWTFFLTKKMKKNPEDGFIKGIISVLELICVLFLIPYNAVRMIYLSQRRSLVGTIRVSSMFFYATHLPAIRFLRKGLNIRKLFDT
ncbi:MAG: B12-binding domain-containing radical SAM protein [Candidatus Hydrogenedentes bacterium]|nr:B12-binding domain-containing radical SAM protein [Candidatus Hydrogenedentota bacterium]